MNELANFKLFHGTDAVFTDLEPSSRGLFGAGIYLTNCIDDAGQYTDTGRVLEVEAHAQSPYYALADYDAGEEIDFDSPAVTFIRELFGDEAEEMLEAARAGDGNFGEEVTKRLEQMGHDAIVIRWSPALVHVVLLYPSQANVNQSIGEDCEAA